MFFWINNAIIKNQPIPTRGRKSEVSEICVCHNNFPLNQPIPKRGRKQIISNSIRIRNPRTNPSPSGDENQPSIVSTFGVSGTNPSPSGDENMKSDSPYDSNVEPTHPHSGTKMKSILCNRNMCHQEPTHPHSGTKMLYRFSLSVYSLRTNPTPLGDENFGMIFCHIFAVGTNPTPLGDENMP